MEEKIRQSYGLSAMAGEDELDNEEWLDWDSSKDVCADDFLNMVRKKIRNCNICQQPDFLENMEEAGSDEFGNKLYICEHCQEAVH